MAEKIVRNDDDKARDDVKKSDAHRDDAKRDDADAGSKLDKLLAGLDSVMSACDDMRKRMDAMDEKADAAHKRMDAYEEKAADKRKDDDGMRDDAKRKDGDEEVAKEALEKEERELAADKKRKDEAKCEDDAKRDDARRDDRMGRKDGEFCADKRDDRRDDSGRRADADVLPDAIARALAEIRRDLPRPVNDAERAVFADAQEAAQRVFSAWGMDAPYPFSTENIAAYKVRCLTKMQQHSPVWKSVDLGALAFADANVLVAAEKQIYADALAASNVRSDLQPGQLIPVVRTDQSGRKITEYRGNGTFVRKFNRPAQRAVFNMTNLNASRNRA